MEEFLSFSKHSCDRVSEVARLRFNWRITFETKTLTIHKLLHFTNTTRSYLYNLGHEFKDLVSKHFVSKQTVQSCVEKNTNTRH